VWRLRRHFTPILLTSETSYRHHSQLSLSLVLCHMAVSVTCLVTLLQEGCRILQWTCLCVCSHISKTTCPNFTKFSVHVNYGVAVKRAPISVHYFIYFQFYESLYVMVLITLNCLLESKALQQLQSYHWLLGQWSHAIVRDDNMQHVAIVGSLQHTLCGIKSGAKLLCRTALLWNVILIHSHTYQLNLNWLFGPWFWMVEKF